MARAHLEGVLADAPRNMVRLQTVAELIALDWLSGDDEAVRLWARELAVDAKAAEARTLEDLARATNGEMEIAGSRHYPRSAAFAGLMRACAAADANARAALCNGVLRGATVAGETFLACLTEVALAQTIPGERFDHAARAAALAEMLDAPLLVDAVERAVDDEPAGPLAPFVRRLRTGQPPAGVFVDIARAGQGPQRHASGRCFRTRTRPP